jgi:Response regulator receiver domain
MGLLFLQQAGARAWSAADVAIRVPQGCAGPKSYSPLTPLCVRQKKSAQLLFKKTAMAAIKILLVDDDEGLCRIMRTLLELEGFDITVAGNVAQALKLIGSLRYDVLLSDLHMPGAADGLTVISAMRHVNPRLLHCC